MKREAEKCEEEQLKRSVSPSVSDGENLQSEIDEDESMYMDHNRKVHKDVDEDESAVEVVPNKKKKKMKKKIVRVVDSSKEDCDK